MARDGEDDKAKNQGEGAEPTNNQSTQQNVRRPEVNDSSIVAPNTTLTLQQEEGNTVVSDLTQGQLTNDEVSIGFKEYRIDKLQKGEPDPSQRSDRTDIPTPRPQQQDAPSEDRKMPAQPSRATRSDTQDDIEDADKSLAQLEAELKALEQKRDNPSQLPLQEQLVDITPQAFQQSQAKGSDSKEGSKVGKEFGPGDRGEASDSSISDLTSSTVVRQREIKEHNKFQEEANRLQERGGNQTGQARRGAQSDDDSYRPGLNQRPAVAQREEPDRTEQRERRRERQADDDSNRTRPRPNQRPAVARREAQAENNASANVTNAAQNLKPVARIFGTRSKKSLITAKDKQQELRGNSEGRKQSGEKEAQEWKKLQDVVLDKKVHTKPSYNEAVDAEWQKMKTAVKEETKEADKDNAQNKGTQLETNTKNQAETERLSNRERRPRRERRSQEDNRAKASRSSQPRDQSVRPRTGRPRREGNKESTTGERTTSTRRVKTLKKPPPSSTAEQGTSPSQDNENKKAAEPRVRRTRRAVGSRDASAVRANRDRQPDKSNNDQAKASRSSQPRDQSGQPTTRRSRREGNKESTTGERTTSTRRVRTLKKPPPSSTAEQGTPPSQDSKNKKAVEPRVRRTRRAVGSRDASAVRASREGQPDKSNNDQSQDQSAEPRKRRARRAVGSRDASAVRESRVEKPGKSNNDQTKASGQKKSRQSRHNKAQEIVDASRERSGTTREPSQKQRPRRTSAQIRADRERLLQSRPGLQRSRGVQSESAMSQLIAGATVPTENVQQASEQAQQSQLARRSSEASSANIPIIDPEIEAAIRNIKEGKNVKTKPTDPKESDIPSPDNSVSDKKPPSADKAPPKRR